MKTQNAIVTTMMRKMNKMHVPMVISAVFSQELIQFLRMQMESRRNINKIMPRWEICSMSSGFG